MTTQRVIHGLNDLPAEVCGGVLTIGNFDGVHLGHRALLARARGLAAPEGLPAIALTFDPPPDLVIRPDDDPQRITPLAMKIGRLVQAGADAVVIATPDRAFLSQSPESFVERIIGRFSPRHMVEGPNFHFGKARKGDVALLTKLGQRAGFDVMVVEPITVDLTGGSQRVSSTLIRGLVLAGDVVNAARCLGDLFALVGGVITGKGIGRTLGFPTININPSGQVLPADGVYAGWADVDGERHPAAIVVINGPTQTHDHLLVEAHLLDVSGDFYGRAVVLNFIQRVRGIERFDSTEALKAQIAKDVERVRAICES